MMKMMMTRVRTMMTMRDTNRLSSLLSLHQTEPHQKLHVENTSRRIFVSA